MSYDEIWFEKTLEGLQCDWALLSSAEAPVPINCELNAHNSSYLLRSALKQVDQHLEDDDVEIHSTVRNRDGRSYLQFTLRVPAYLHKAVECLQVRVDRRGQAFFKFKTPTAC